MAGRWSDDESNRLTDGDGTRTRGFRPNPMMIPRTLGRSRWLMEGRSPVSVRCLGMSSVAPEPGYLQIAELGLTRDRGRPRNASAGVGKSIRPQEERQWGREDRVPHPIPNGRDAPQGVGNPFALCLRGKSGQNSRMTTGTAASARSQLIWMGVRCAIVGIARGLRTVCLNDFNLLLPCNSGCCRLS